MYVGFNLSGTFMNVKTTHNIIKITESASTKISNLIQEEGDSSLMLRTYITGGGCSGFQYGFMFEKAAKTDDTKVHANPLKNNKKGKQKVTVLIDPISLQYLIGAEIDYKQDVNGQCFIIRNPNAKTTCGCGSSFST